MRKLRSNVVFVIRLTNTFPSDGRAICAWRNPVPQFDGIHDVTVSATLLRIDLEMSQRRIDPNVFQPARPR
jgi:hypothetical protein